MFEPLKNLYFLLMIGALEVLSCEIVDYSVGLVDGSFWREEDERLVLFGYFLGIDLFIEKEECQSYLF